MSSQSTAALKAAFPHTLPILAGYGFLGITYGILMTTSGFPFWLPIVTALIMYTGSMEFLMVQILLSSFNPLSTFVTSLMVGARHLFYGLSLLGTYRDMPWWKKLYLVFSTSDETFAIVYSTPVPEGVDKVSFHMWISFLDQMYWVIGATIGALFGGLITFNTEGLDFVMTAMFVVIFLNQWMQDGTSLRTLVIDHASEFVGVLGSVLCLLVFGPDNFIVPTMIVILIALALLRGRLEPAIDAKAAAEELGNDGQEVPGEAEEVVR